jgi:hypothetical protein
LSPLCSRMSLFSCLRCFSCFQPTSFIIDVIDPSSLDVAPIMMKKMKSIFSTLIIIELVPKFLLFWND